MSCVRPKVPLGQDEALAPKTMAAHHDRTCGTSGRKDHLELIADEVCAYAATRCCDRAHKRRETRRPRREADTELSPHVRQLHRHCRKLNAAGRQPQDTSQLVQLLDETRLRARKCQTSHPVDLAVPERSLEEWQLSTVPMAPLSSTQL